MDGDSDDPTGIEGLAEYVRERRAFEVLPILADALEDAGCDDRDVLEHCRRPRRPTAGC